MPQKMLVVAAHLGDFIWRSGGVIAKYAQAGHEVHVIVLTYGLRGESKEYWKRPGATLEDGMKVRREEGLEVAKILGVTGIEFCEYGDYPLQMTDERIEALAIRIRQIRPDFIITHDKEMDLYNPDHNLTSQAVMKAYSIASAYGAYYEGTQVAPRQTPIFGYEPHNTEACNFKPMIFIDISDVIDTKIAAMEAVKSQQGMTAQYVRKAEVRASQCGIRGNKPCKYAEAFTMFGPIFTQEFFVW